MKILGFSCKLLNEYLNYKFSFHDDVSFLHGINGAGKTSVLRSIAALLTPDPYWLITASYEHISVDVMHKNMKWSISSEKKDAKINIKVNAGRVSASDTLIPEQYSQYIMRVDEEVYRNGDADYSALKMMFFGGSVSAFKLIDDLPTPLFFGLDRTTLSQVRTRNGLRNKNRSIHPYARTQLDDALTEAERFLSEALSELSKQRNSIFEDLRNKFVLSLFPSLDAGGVVHDTNYDSDPNSIVTLRRSIVPALRKINLSESEIKENVEPFFVKVMEAHSRMIKAEREREKRDASNERFMEYINEVTPWYSLRPYLHVMAGTVASVKIANEKEARLSHPFENYRNAIHSFLEDSHKELQFDGGRVSVRLPSGRVSDIRCLSSGERQIFVLLTNLVFNPEMNTETVLLIDEPELSLHLKWQKQFVDSIKLVSPETQMILATHSPEIIFNRNNKLIHMRG